MTAPSSDCSDEMEIESGRPVMPPIDTSFKIAPLRPPWYKRPRVCYTIAIALVLISLAGATFAVLLGIGIVEIPRSSSSASTGTTAATSASPTSAPTPAATTTTTTTTAVPDPQPTAPPPTASPTQQPTAFVRTEPLAFYAMGDVPYSFAESQVLISQMSDMAQNVHPGAAFVIHVGDMMVGKETQCAEPYFQSVRNILSTGPRATFVLAGDNDYLDCPDLDLAWLYYTNAFVDFEQDWSDRLPPGVPELDVVRWRQEDQVPSALNVARPEMFAFVEDGILFLSLTVLNMPNGALPDDLFYERLNHTLAWVEHQVVEKTSQQQIRGTIMFGHALIMRYNRHLFEALKNVFYQNNLYTPVVYLHGDGHDYEVDLNRASQLGWPGFVDVQVEQGAHADPLLVEVAPIQNGVMQPLMVENPMQTVLSSGLFRLDQQNGNYNAGA